MLNRRQTLGVLIALLATSWFSTNVEAQTESVKSEIYFGSELGTGQTVSQ